MTAAWNLCLAFSFMFVVIRISRVKLGTEMDNNRT
jgi:hypothetical protein